jgi:hypothetical protein
MVAVVALIVVWSIAFEKVAVAAAVTATPVAPSLGVFAVTVGGEGGGGGGVAPVENVHVYGSYSETPSWAVTAFVRVAVYVVLSASAAVGVSVAFSVAGSYTTVAATALPPALTVNVAVLIVALLIARGKVAVTTALEETLPAPAAGLTAVGRGEVLSTWVRAGADAVELPALSTAST